MAKKSGGFFGALGSLGKLLIWGFAALAVVAIYLGLSGPTAPPSETTAEALEEGTTDAGEAEVEEAEPEVAEEPAAEAEDAPAPEAAEAEAAEPADTMEAAEPSADEATGDAADAAEAEAPLPDSGPADLTDEFEEEAAEEGAVDGGAATATAPLAEFPVPGEDAVIRLMSVEPIEGERFQATLEREAGGEVQTTTIQLTCAPRAVGLVVEDGGTPELEVIVPGTPEAEIAEAACAAVE